MTWVLVGYIAKRLTTRAGWVSPWESYPGAGFPCAAPVEEICSVSNCIARGLWSEDAPLGLHADAKSARAAIPIGSQADYALYAYWLWSIQFKDGDEEEIDLWWKPAAVPMAKTFARLGWDAVVGGEGYSFGFGCSPLSCNVGADDVQCSEINRYCLVADESSAMALALRFSICQPEPGPYCIVDVWRDTATVVEPSIAAK